MPSLHFEAETFDVPRNITLLDTNVLCSFALPEEANHESTRLYLEAEDRIWGIIPSVIVETWGLLVGSRKRRQEALSLLRWLLTPNADLLLLPDLTCGLRVHGDFAREHGVDIVDAKLIETAHLLTTRCELSPPVDVATYDARDFVTCERRHTGFRFRVTDLRFV